MIRRTLRRIREDESGLSLAELLVSGLLTIAIMAMIGTMFIQTAKITANSTQTSKSNNIAANIANEVTSVIRVATTNARAGATLPDAAIVSGTRESLQLYALSNTNATTPSPSRITFTVVPGSGTVETRSVTEEICTATASGGFWVFSTCGSIVNRNLGGAVQPLTGVSDQFFTYYTDTAGTAPILIGTGSLSAAQCRTVASIRIYVSVKASGSQTKTTVINNLVVLGNLGLEDL
jgi:Tfp pilus assembly protein PilW